jgi:hypothetical protein
VRWAAQCSRRMGSAARMPPDLIVGLKGVTAVVEVETGAGYHRPNTAGQALELEGQRAFSRGVAARAGARGGIGSRCW